jgi:nitroreductase
MMKDFLSLAKDRYSCRSYLSTNIPKELIEKVLEAARIAPSATNAQPWRFVVVTQSPLREHIASCYARPWLSMAPVIIVACGDHSISWRRADGKDHCDIDIAIAIDHITLAAAEAGLATCWICKFDALKCAEFLKLPSHISPIALISLGFPADKPSDSERHLKRKPLNEIVSWEGFSG